MSVTVKEIFEQQDKISDSFLQLSNLTRHESERESGANGPWQQAQELCDEAKKNINTLLKMVRFGQI
jgi:hypothetical protein